MTGNQFYLDGRLYRFNYTGSGPPWPLEVWDDSAQAWQAIGNPLPMPQASTLLAITSKRNDVWADYLATSDGEAVVAANGSSITIGPLRVINVPEFILTESSDVIGVLGR